MKPAKAIELARKRAALSQEGLAEKSGVSLRTISNLENGHRTPNGATLTALARAMGYTSYEELLKAVGEKSSGPRSPAGLIPVLGSVKAGFDWDGDHADGADNGVGVGYIQRHLVGIDDPDAFAVIVDGDSMMPDMAPGETVICSPSAAKAKIVPGRVYAIRLGARHNHEATIKRVEFSEGDDEWTLRPSNPRHPSRVVRAADIDRMAEVVAGLRRYAK